MAKNSPQDLENREVFSANLNRLMSEKGIRQIDLHNSLDIPKSTITGYVKGRSLPTPGNVQKIADFLNVKKSDLDPRFLPTNQLEEKTPQTLEKEVNSFIQRFTSMSERQQQNFFKELKNHLQKQGEPTDFLKKTSDVLTHLTGLQEEVKTMTIKAKRLDEELRIANIAKEILEYDENDTVALNMLKEKHGEEDFNKAIDYIDNLDID